MEMLKQIYSLKSLSLGWSVFWRSFLVMLVNMIILGIIGALLQQLGAIIQTLIGIALLIINIMAMGWAAQRIKDKL